MLTGGTIGSVADENNVRGLDNRNNSILMSKFSSDDEVLISSPFTILSEMMDGEHITRLVSETEKVLRSGVEGIIITHGTDTIQYSAAALAYAFADTDVPIVLVSSNMPLDFEGSNGLDNLEAAIAFIRSGLGDGVFAAYRNGNESTKIHRATRLLANHEYDEYFNSLDGKYYASYENGQCVKNPCYEELTNDLMIGPFTIKDSSNTTLIIRPYVGFGMEIDLDEVEDIIIHPYHSGTINTANEKLKKILENAKSSGIRVWMIGSSPDVVYESMVGLKGVRILPRMTEISAYMKLWILKSKGMEVDLILSPSAGDIMP